MRISIRLSLLFLCLTLGGCASGRDPKDPFESFNRGMYQLNDTVDKAVVKPAAKGYNAVVPPPAKMMLSNFFSNLNDVVVAVNDLLQFKIAQAISDTGRVVVNSTGGLFGLADVATAVGLEKHDEDFGQTLGRWGIGSGPYLVLPLLGPSSVRDGIGLYADGRASPMRKVEHVDIRNQGYAVNLLGKRSALLDKEDVLDEAAIDRYSFIREAYLQHRQSQVYDGNPPRVKYEDEEEDSKPEKHSSGNQESAVPVVATPVVAPAAVEELVAAPTFAAVVSDRPTTEIVPIRHLWVSQGNGMH